MKECKKCGAMLSDSTTKCGKCGCPVNDSVTELPKDSEAVYKYQNTKRDYVDIWMYVAAVLCPLVGIVFSCISYAKGEDDVCKKLLTASLVSLYICMIIWIIVSSNQNEEMMNLIRRMY
ncbi:MAG: hypothetical protein ACI4JN_06055 [Ruminococcus sp.]